MQPATVIIWKLEENGKKNWRKTNFGKIHGHTKLLSKYLHLIWLWPLSLSGTHASNIYKNIGVQNPHNPSIIKGGSKMLNPIQGGGAKTPALHFFIKLLLKGSSKLLLQWSVISILYINKGLKQKRIDILLRIPPFSPSKKFQQKLGVSKEGESEHSVLEYS